MELWRPCDQQERDEREDRVATPHRSQRSDAPVECRLPSGAQRLIAVYVLDQALVGLELTRAVASGLPHGSHRLPPANGGCFRRSEVSALS